jgi:hypothetical protein
MNWDFIQGDFSAGELTPKTQGNIGSDIYKAGASRMANAVPTRGKSFASRGGGKWLADSIALGTGGANSPPTGNTLLEERGLPVQHIPVHDGPYGDFVIEVGPWYVRLMDRTGVLSWHAPIADLTLDGVPNMGGTTGGWSSGADGYTDVWGDKASGTLYLNNSNGVGQRTLTTVQIPNYEAAASPAGTDGSWNFSGKLAGDAVTLRLRLLVAGDVVDIPIARGEFNINFSPRHTVGVDDSFSLTLLGPLNTVAASTLWDLKLAKNGEQTISAPFIGEITSPDRVRASPGFWVNDQFWVVLVGLSGGPYALCWTTPANRAPVWTFAALNFVVSDGSFAAADAVTVAAYQDRLWLGLGDKKASLEATQIGYGRVVAGQFQFQFGPTKDTGVGDGALKNFAFHFAINPTPGTDPGVLLTVTLAGVVQPLANFGTFPNADQVANPGGFISFVAAPPLGQAITITRANNVVTATDALSLKLASPTGRIVWLNVLHGLVLGSTRMEKTFTQNAALAIDPASGMDFELLDHSSLGSDENLPALNVNEKLMFLQRGRQILRSASVRFMWESGLPQNGLIAEDVGGNGEHLLRPKVRALCYLKSPVPRLVFAFDDGTGAVATLNPQFGLTWSRFTIPAAFGGIFSVASLDSTDSSELWVGTETGLTLHWDNFESDIVKKTLYTSTVGSLVAPTRTLYDVENPLPPVMDGWHRLPGSGKFIAFGADKTQWSRALIGQNAYVLVNGQPYGPYQVKDDGGGVAEITELGTLKVNGGDNGGGPGSAAGIPFNWVDGNGKRRAMEIYVGLAYPEHRATTLPLEGGNPVGTSQALKARMPQLYVRFVDSYMPKVNGTVPAERGPADPTDQAGGRITGDVRCTELGFQRAHVIDIVQDAPLRMEVSAVFGGTQVNNL